MLITGSGKVEIEEELIHDSCIMLDTFSIGSSNFTTKTLLFDCPVMDSLAANPKSYGSETTVIEVLKDGFNQFIQKRMRLIFLFENEDDVVCVFQIDKVHVRGYLNTVDLKTIQHSSHQLIPQKTLLTSCLDTYSNLCRGLKPHFISIYCSTHGAKYTSIDLDHTPS
ncbi:hypothetical protein CLF_108074 [Clonorchis sinensis]|uniref:Uncharacterized protein n=1 Tax=Clonorchis sinensis TaxID=79923 RepID=G7YHK2_CLOSI|nr:hypothetical protein CLF_108074 [Clonorchis sinensis]